MPSVEVALNGLDRAMKQRLCLGFPSHQAKYLPLVSQAQGEPLALGVDPPFENGDSSVSRGKRFGKPAEVSENGSEVSEANRNIRMVHTDALFF